MGLSNCKEDMGFVAKLQSLCVKLETTGKSEKMRRWVNYTFIQVFPTIQGNDQ